MVTIKSRPIPVTNYTDVFDEDMVAKSISYRKAKYDEGLNTVQSEINQMSQIPTLTKEDGQYLNERINQLTNTINSAGGVDFSNNMNLSKVKSLETDIYNDRIIQNAVSSAKNHQKQMKFIDDAKNNPKKYGDVLSPYNERDYNDQLQSYQQKRANGEEAVFSYQYKPYVDIQGELAKRIEKLKADSYTNVNGNYFIDTTKLSPEKIRAVAYGELMNDPKMLSQLQINARYNTEHRTDAELIQLKNHVQRNNVLEKKEAMDREVNRLFSLDPKNPERSAVKLEQAKTQLDKYNKAYQLLSSNSNQILESEEGDTLAKDYSRQSLALELTANQMLKGLESMSYQQQKVRANMIPLTEGKFEFDKQYKIAQMDFRERKFKEIQKQNAIDNQFKALEIEKSKKSVKGKGSDGEELEPGTIDYTTPEITKLEDVKATFEAEANNTKTQARLALKEIFVNKLTKLASVVDRDWTERYVDLIVNKDSSIRNLDVDKSVQRIKGKLIQFGNKEIPEDAAIKATIQWINTLSADARKVWNGEGLMNRENAQVLSQYTDMIQKAAIYNNVPKDALRDALSKNGLSVEQYNELKKNNPVQFKTTYTSMSGVPTKIPINNQATAKIAKIEADMAQYYKDKASTTNLYAVQNYSKKDENVNTQVNAILQSSGGLSKDGMTISGNVYGKENQWGITLPENSSVQVKQYNPKTERILVDVYDAEGKVISKGQSFKMPLEYMKSHLAPELLEANKDLEYTNQLRLTNNGSSTITDTKGKSKQFWKTLPTGVPIQWKATLNDINNTGDNSCTVYMKIPFNGKLYPYELKTNFSNPDYAGKELEKGINQFISDELKKGVSEKDIPARIIQFIKTL